MTLSTPDIAAIAGYFILIGIVAYFTRRTKTFEDFSIGKHSVPAIMVFASLAATIVGPGFSVGFTGQGWSAGFLFYFLVLAYSAQVVFVGLFLAPKLSEHRDCQSLGDVMRKKYGPFAQLLTGIVSVGLCIGFTAIMGKVGGGTLHAVTGWPLTLCLIAVTGTTALVTFSGGVRATVATEAMQFAIMTLIIGVFALMAVNANPVSLGDISQAAVTRTSEALAGMTTWQVVGIVVAFMLGEALIPPYANRALAAKSSAGSRSGFIAAGLFCIAWLAMVSLLGNLAHEQLPSDTSPDDVFVLLARTILPAGVFGALLAAIIAIVMSSQEAVLNSAAMSFLRDVVAVFRKPSDQLTLVLAKVATIIFAAIAIYAAQFAPSIISGLLILYAIWAPTILVPLVFALYLKDTRPAAGWLSILTGGGVSIVWTQLGEPMGFPSILVGLAASAVAYFIGHVLSPRTTTSSQKAI